MRRFIAAVTSINGFGADFVRMYKELSTFSVIFSFHFSFTFRPAKCVSSPRQPPDRPREVRRSADRPTHQPPGWS